MNIWRENNLAELSTSTNASSIIVILRNRRRPENKDGARSEVAQVAKMLHTWELGGSL